MLYKIMDWLEMIDIVSYNHIQNCMKTATSEVQEPLNVCLHQEIRVEKS